MQFYHRGRKDLVKRRPALPSQPRACEGTGAREPRSRFEGAGGARAEVTGRSLAFAARSGRADDAGVNASGDIRLIVRGDDFGMCHAVNQGIAAAFGEGIVTTSSAMAPCPWFGEAVEIARDLRIPLGVHQR